MRIFIIGFTSSGKTTFGKKLAKETGFEFIDLDHFILDKYHKPIQKIFEEKGEVFLRQLESKALNELMHKDNVVISTGGGAPCFYDNMQLMNEHGLTIYLEASPEFLVSRLKQEIGERPLIRMKTEEQLRIFVNKLLEKRERYYRMAHLFLDAINPDLEKVKKYIQQ